MIQFPVRLLGAQVAGCPFRVRFCDYYWQSHAKLRAVCVGDGGGRAVCVTRKGA